MQSESSQTISATQANDLRTISKPNKRQQQFIQAWLDPNSDTFANTYQSALVAGYSEKTARVLTANSRNTPWITEVKQLLLQYEPQHIYAGIQNIANSGKQDRDKLRALELLAKIQGMFIERTQSDITVNFTNSVPRPVIDITGVDAS